MLIKRLILAGAVVGISIALAHPHANRPQTEFVISGGYLKRPISFSSDQIGPARGWWWHAESRVPPLTGPRYRLRFHDSGSRAVTEWTYIPDASGAVVNTGRMQNGPVAWMAFTPAFNADLQWQMHDTNESVEARGLLALLAVGAGILLLMTVAGLPFYAMPRWVMRKLHDARVAVAADAGPAYLYTSVPRAQWPWMGRLGRAPGGRTRPS